MCWASRCVAGRRRRRSAGARGPRVPAAARAGVAAHGPADRSLRRLVTTVGTFLVVLLVPAGEQALWVDAPLAGLAQHLAAPRAAEAPRARAGRRRGAGAAPGRTRRAHRCRADAAPVVGRRHAAVGLASLHTRFGTPARAIDITSSPRSSWCSRAAAGSTWLARAYGVAIARCSLLTIAALVRLRRTRPGTAPFKAGSTSASAAAKFRSACSSRRHVVVCVRADMVLSGDGPRSPPRRLIAVLLAVVHRRRATAAPVELSAEESTFDLLARRRALARSGRGPSRQRAGARSQSARAGPRVGRAAGARRSGRRRHDRAAARRRRQRGRRAAEGTPTPYERRLLSDVVAVAERVGRPVRLLIVPARNVVDAIVAR